MEDDFALNWVPSHILREEIQPQDLDSDDHHHYCDGQSHHHHHDHCHQHICTRLGALGFLSLDPDESNLGLRDQALALSWVKI